MSATWYVSKRIHPFRCTQGLHYHCSEAQIPVIEVGGRFTLTHSGPYLYLTLPMLRLLWSKAQRRKDFRKPFNILKETIILSHNNNKDVFTS